MVVFEKCLKRVNRVKRSCEAWGQNTILEPVASHEPRPDLSSSWHVEATGTFLTKDITKLMWVPKLAPSNIEMDLWRSQRETSELQRLGRRKYTIRIKDRRRLTWQNGSQSLMSLAPSKSNVSSPIYSLRLCICKAPGFQSFFGWEQSGQLGWLKKGETNRQHQGKHGKDTCKFEKNKESWGKTNRTSQIQTRTHWNGLN